MKIVIFFAFLFLSLASNANNLTFKKAQTIAQAHDARHESRVYLKEDVIPFYENTYNKILNNCYLQHSLPDLEKFIIIAKVQETGAVSNTWVNKHTNISTCLQDAINGHVFPKPPFSPYMLEIVMSVKP